MIMMPVLIGVVPCDADFLSVSLGARWGISAQGLGSWVSRGDDAI